MLLSGGTSAHGVEDIVFDDIIDDKATNVPYVIYQAPLAFQDRRYTIF